MLIFGGVSIFNGKYMFKSVIFFKLQRVVDGQQTSPANQKIPESTYSMKYQVAFSQKSLGESQRNQESKQVEDVSLKCWKCVYWNP